MTRTKCAVWAILIAIGLPVVFPGETQSICECVSDAIARAKETALPAQGAPPIDLGPGRELTAFPNHSRSSDALVAFAPDGQSVAASWDVDGSWSVGLFDAVSRESRWQVALKNREPCGIAFTPDGQTLAVGGNEGIKLLDAKTGIERSVFGETAANRVRLAYSPNGKTLIALDEVPFLEVWDTTSGKQMFTSRVNTRSPEGIAVSPDGKFFATCGSGPMRCRPSGPFGMFGIGCGSRGGRIWIWQPDQSDEPRVFETRSRAFDVAFAPDAKTLASASVDGVKLWDLATGQGRRILNGEAHSLAYSSDGRTLAIGLGNDYDPNARNEIVLFDLATERSPSVLRGNLGTVVSLAFAPNGKTLVASGSKGVAIWNLKPGE